MKNFREYLQEAEKQIHNKGTYASLKLNEKSKKILYNWLIKNGFENLAAQESYHCTVLYSRKTVPEVSKWEVEFPLTARPIRWRIFPTNNDITKDGHCLVLEIKNPIINKLHYKAEELGATYDYDEYIPHVTVCTSYDKDEVPNILPKIKLAFDEFEVTELDLEKSIDEN